MISFKYFNNCVRQLSNKSVIEAIIIENIIKRNYSIRRALLYVPGDSERKLKKAFNLNVDCIAVDCEDGVAINKKTVARETIHSMLGEGKPPNAKFDLTVRVNSIESGLAEDDLSHILSAKNLPDSILLPKVTSIEDVKWFQDKLKKYMKNDHIVNFLMLIESANAMINLVDICKLAKEMSGNKFIPSSLIFGSDDFCANIGAMRTENSIEILYARQKLVLVAKAFGLQAIDMVHINYKDLNDLQRNCEEGMRMGYTGKQVIHPDQVPVVQTAFLPNKFQIQWATELIEAFKKHEKSGVGAFTFRGSMIDMPTVKQAENVINLVKSVEKTK